MKYVKISRKDPLLNETRETCFEISDQGIVLRRITLLNGVPVSKADLENSELIFDVSGSASLAEKEFQTKSEFDHKMELPYFRDNPVKYSYHNMTKANFETLFSAVEFR